MTRVATCSHCGKPIVSGGMPNTNMHRACYLIHTGRVRLPGRPVKVSSWP